MSAPPEWWAEASQALQSSILQAQQQQLNQIITPVQQDVKQVKTDMVWLKERQDNVEARLRAIESGEKTTSTGQWKPSFVDILGFCEYKDVQTKGITRTEAVTLVETLKSGLDPTLQCHVRDIELRSGKNYSVRVPITPQFVYEIKNTWNDWCGQDSNKYKGEAKLWVRAQRPPEVQKRYEMMGKMVDWVASLNPKLEPNPQWAPDFTMLVTYCNLQPPAGGSVIPGGPLCEVQEGGTINWDLRGLAAAGFQSAEAAKMALAKFRRPRK